MTYQVFRLSMETDIQREEDIDPIVTEWLNEKIKIGWEVVCFIGGVYYGEVIAVFKRYSPLPEPPKEPEQADLFGDRP